MGDSDPLVSWFGKPYANEQDPSWEDVIAMVVIPGEPSRITTAADKWDVLFTRMREAKRVLDDGVRDLASWKGPGGEAYRAHLTQVSISLDHLIEDHRGLTAGLRTAADDLQTAINDIPIPDDMVHEVMAAKNGFIDTGKITNGLFHPGAIYNYLLPIVGNKWFDAAREFFTWDWAAKQLRDWVSSEDDKAREAYHTLGDNHANTLAHLPGPTPGKQFHVIAPVAPTNVTPPKVGGPGMPDTGLSAVPGLDPSNGGRPGDGRPGPATGPGVGGLPGSDPSGTGLASVGDGLVGAGADGFGPGRPGAFGGLGPGSALGPGVGLGPGGAPGPFSGPGAGVPGGAVAGGLPVDGGSRSGSRSSRGAGTPGKAGVRGGVAGAARPGAAGMGMVPRAGADGDGEGEDHTTWLKEDENVWGVDGDPPPAVLR